MIFGILIGELTKALADGLKFPCDGESSGERRQKFECVNNHLPVQ